MADQQKFGITLVLPYCAFAVELQRDALMQAIREIDDRLTEEGAPEDAESRCEAMVDNALAVSTMMAKREIEHDAGVADIAYSFLYVMGKTVGFEQMDNVRGLTGTYMHDILNLNPCLGDEEYQKETTLLQQHMRDDEFEWDMVPPTIH